MQPPIAKRIPHPHHLHGDVREDDYYWMKDRDNEDVIHYLEEENRYYDEVMRPLENQTEEIYQSMIDRVPEKEENVPVQHGPYFYYSRMDKSKQYPIYARKYAKNRDLLGEAKEEIVLDLNDMVEAEDYLSVTEQRMSTDQKRLAYLENRDGTDRYTIFIKDMETGNLLEDRIPNVFLFGSLEWSRCGEYIFYTMVDDNQRPYQVWRHRLGENPERDELIYEENEETFTLYIYKSQSGKFIFIQTRSKTSCEIHIIDADSPLTAPKVLDERRPNIEYDVEHWGNDLLILTNEQAENFQLQRCSLDDWTSRENVVAYEDGKYLLAVYPFQNGLYIYGRERGLAQIWQVKQNQLEKVKWDEPIYDVSVMANQSYEAEEVLVNYNSLLTPKTTYALNLDTGERTCLQVAPVSGEYERDNYIQEQIWATVEDGVKVPMMAVYRKGALDAGPAPLILSGYGSYGANSDPYFSPYQLPLLDKGIVFVTAQVRGGSEMGRSWYENGKMQQKRNTFTDFIAAAKHLIEHQYTTPNQLAARGGSAGGLLVGAVANMAGDLFQVIVPEVPFVDVVTTMLDTSLPLTTLEWDEWGDPRKEEDYFYMKSYSPYDNVEAKDYPHLYITTGLNDPRVGYFEPAKWVARLRALKTDDNTIIMKTNMSAGHFGKSGRFNHLKEAAELSAFVLNRIGVEEGSFVK